MKKIIVLSLIAILSTFTVNATHIYGSEMTWECIKSGPNAGRFIFTVKWYRNCSGANSTPNSITITHPFGPSIFLPRVSQSDISPACYLGQEIDCYNPANDDKALEETIYQNAVPVALVGTPTGPSLFSASGFCCRPAVDNLNGQNSYALRAYMYPYQINGVNQSLGTAGNPTCFDSSPQFAEIPAATICTDYEFTYNHNATDEELDSLDYQWDVSIDNVGVTASYSTGFTFSSPLPSPGVPSDPNNVAATLDNKTGEIRFTAFDDGKYVTTVRVDAYKCGQKVAAIFRDIPVNLLECDPLPPPFNTIFNVPPDVDISGQPSYADTVLAGQYVSFPINASDAGVLPGFASQSIIMEPTGLQFGAAFSDSLTGCPYPPCAVLDTNPALGYYEPPAGGEPARFNSSSSTVAGTNIETTFTWKTDCNHLARTVSANGFVNCFVRENSYTFVFKVLDDYCPAPGQNFVTASITVEAPDAIDPPELKCATLLANGDVDLSWNIPVDSIADVGNSFRDYIIFRSSTRSGTYTAIDTIRSISTSSYTDIGANAQLPNPTKYYYIMGRSSCNAQAQQIFSDTLAAMALSASPYNGGNSAILSWPHFVETGFPATTTGKYYVWQVFNSDTTLIDSLTDNVDTVGVFECFPADITYFVTVEDTTLTWGCTSYSNSETLTLGDNTAPSAVLIDSVSIDPITGDVDISWGASLDPDAFQYYIYQNGVKVDSVLAPGTTITLPGPIGNVAPEDFSISVVDGCNNESVPGLVHSSMFLDIINLSRCETDKNITVQWTGYVGWSADYYELYCDTGIGPHLVTTIAGTTPAPITYVDNNIFGSNFYTYYVRAVDTTGGNRVTATSVTDTLNLLPLITNTIVDPPQLICISIEVNGDIKLDWNVPPNPDLNFDSYIIYHSTDGVQFDSLDIITGLLPSDNAAYLTDTFIHVGPDPTQDHYYQIRSRSGCYGTTLSAVSNTLKPLEFTIGSVGTNVNKLDWEFIPPPATIAFEVKREYPIGSGLFTTISSLPKTIFSSTDTNNNCVDSANYRIEIQDPFSGCISKSNEAVGYYRDNVAPALQIQDTASVFNDSAMIVGWSANPSPDVVAYYVLRQEASGVTILDTIFVTPGQTNFSYIDYEHGSGCITTVAVDSCGNTDILSGNFDYHCVMQAEVVVDKCDQSFLVQWNGYETFESGPDVQYDVFMSTNGGTFNVIGTTDKTNYRFDSPISGNNYCFYIQATENDGAGPFTSRSDSVCQTATFLIKPEYAYLQYVTVSQENNVELAVWVDIKADIFEYVIHRSIGDSNHFKAIETIEVPNPITPADVVLSYKDPSAKTEIRPNYYKVDVVDPCGEVVKESNLGRTILLKVEANNDSKSNVLRWNSYLRWSGDVKSYKVYRNGKRVGTVAPPEDIDQAITFTDDVSDLVEKSEGLFCYYVEAEEGDPLFAGLADHATSKSNEVCVIQYPLFYIPNAFTPGNTIGLNDIFKPEGIFVKLENYKFEIYDRWGTQVFSTNDFETGWDGKVEGKEAQTGAYIYFIRFEGADGKEFQQKGTVNVLR